MTYLNFFSPIPLIHWQIGTWLFLAIALLFIFLYMRGRAVHEAEVNLLQEALYIIADEEIEKQIVFLEQHYSPRLTHPPNAATRAIDRNLGRYYDKHVALGCSYDESIHSVGKFLNEIAKTLGIPIENAHDTRAGRILFSGIAPKAKLFSVLEKFLEKQKNPKRIILVLQQLSPKAWNASGNLKDCALRMIDTMHVLLGKEIEATESEVTLSLLLDLADTTYCCDLAQENTAECFKRDIKEKIKKSKEKVTA